MKERKIMIMNRKELQKSLLPYTFLLVFILGCLIVFNFFNNTINELSYDEFLKSLNGIVNITIMDYFNNF